MSVQENVDTLYSKMFKELAEEHDNYIEIIDSEKITIHKSDTTFALSLQSAVSALITVTTQLLISDSDIADIVASDLIARSTAHSRKKVKIKIINCYNITITLSATDIMASVQALNPNINRSYNRS